MAQSQVYLPKVVRLSSWVIWEWLQTTTAFVVQLIDGSMEKVMAGIVSE